MRMLIMITLLMLAGCGAMPTTDQQRYERANAEVLRLEAFAIFEVQCKRQGGNIEIRRREWMPRYCTWRKCPPGRMDSVRCVSR